MSQNSLARLEESAGALEVSLGGRAGMLDLLAHSAHPDAEAILRVLSDPTEDELTLSALLHHSGITYGKLLAALRDAHLAKAQMAAVERLAASLPEVVSSVAAEAKDRKTRCEPCAGTGIVGKGKSAKPCEPCDGSGQVTKAGNLESQKMFLEMAGMLKSKTGGATVNLQQQINQGVSLDGDFLKTFRDVTDKVLYGGDR